MSETILQGPLDDPILYLQNIAAADEEENDLDHERDNKEPELTKCLGKCAKRYCFSDMNNSENIYRYKESSVTEAQIQSETESQIDSIRSGESLFKSFSFDPAENSAEMDKCMAFWKTVLESKLTPLKFSVTGGSKKPKTKKKPQLEEVPQKQKSCSSLVAAQVNETWKRAWKEIQKKKLDEIKLRESRRRSQGPCGFDESDQVDNTKIKKEIKALNNWTPSSKAQNADMTSKIDKLISKEAQRTQAGARRKVSKGTTKSRPISEPLYTSLVELPPSSSSPAGPATADPNERNAPPNELLAKERSKAQVENKVEPETHTIEEVASFKCRCGCDQQDCICEQLGNDIDLLFVANQGGCSCGCNLSCICTEVESVKVNSSLCKCGCHIAGCICQELSSPPALDKKCPCGCGLTDCICQEIGTIAQKSQEYSCGDKKCPCGCGLTDCICQEMGTIAQKSQECSCGCGVQNCNCASLLVRNVKRQSSVHIGAPLVTAVTSVGVQSESVEDIVPDGNGIYCAICGHFDCYCSTS